MPRGVLLLFIDSRGLEPYALSFCGVHSTLGAVTLFHLPYRVRVLSCLDARRVNGPVRLVSDVEHHDSPVVAAHRQERLVDRVEVEAHHLGWPERGEV